jgi:hypothetical protein
VGRRFFLPGRVVVKPHAYNGDKSIADKAYFLKEVRLPRLLSHCWIYTGRDIAAARVTAHRLWKRESAAEVVAEEDCHLACVNFAHLHGKGAA